MKNPYIEYINELQANLQAIRRPHNEIRAIGRVISEMCTARRDFQNIVQQHQATINSVQRTLSLLPTFNDTVRIEKLRGGGLSGKRKNRDFTRFDFTHFDELPPKQDAPQTQPKQKLPIGFRPPRKKSQP